MDIEDGREALKCGFKIGGGIDQDYKQSPQGYTDYVCFFLGFIKQNTKVYIFFLGNLCYRSS